MFFFLLRRFFSDSQSSFIHFVVHASASPEGGEPDAKFGLGGPGTWFGFGKKQEKEVGRLAMLGFTVMPPSLPSCFL